MEKNIKRTLLCAAVVGLMLTGCGEKEQVNGEENIQHSSEMGKQESDATDSASNAADSSSVDGIVDGQQEGELYMDIPEGQIQEQSFEVTLDGWGEVTFASFEPEHDTFTQNSIVLYGDARFMLLKDEKVVYVFPEVYLNNGMTGQKYEKVLAVSFKDYDEDGRQDILLLVEYGGVQGIDIGEVWTEARIYTQDEGEREFHLHRSLMYAINSEANYNGATMEDVYRVIGEYAGRYSIASDRSAWEIERFAADIRKALFSGDFETLSEKISYPITIDEVVYRNSEEFLSADFIGNPSETFLENIRKEADTDTGLFCNWQGFMLGKGEVWFADLFSSDGYSTWADLKIITINGISKEPDEIDLQMEALNARMEYYLASAYYQEITDYWENTREVRDIANRTDFLFETDSQYYTAEDFKNEPLLVIHLAKNEIYARHGYTFSDSDLYNYFMGCIWYTPTTVPQDFDVSVFNEYERENLKVLTELDKF